MNYKQFGFNDFDFIKLFFPIHKFPDDADMFVAFPALEKYQEFKAEIELPFREVMRYIVLAFDVHSPLRAAYKDINEQRVKAALISGFKTDKKGKFTPYVEKMLLSEIPEINRMIIRYVSMLNNEDYTTFISYSEALRKQQEKLFIGEDEQEKTKEIITNINTLKSAINVLKETMLGTYDDIKMNRSLYEFVESDNLGISPEEIASLYNFNINNPIAKPQGVRKKVSKG